MNNKVTFICIIFFLMTNSLFAQDKIQGIDFKNMTSEDCANYMSVHSLIPFYFSIFNHNNDYTASLALARVDSIEVNKKNCKLYIEPIEYFQDGHLGGEKSILEVNSNFTSKEAKKYLTTFGKNDTILIHYWVMLNPNTEINREYQLQTIIYADGSQNSIPGKTRFYPIFNDVNSSIMHLTKGNKDRILDEWKYFKKAFESSRKSNNWQSVVNNYWELTTMYELKGNKDLAIASFSQYINYLLLGVDFPIYSINRNKKIEEAIKEGVSVCEELDLPLSFLLSSINAASIDYENIITDILLNKENKQINKEYIENHILKLQQLIINYQKQIEELNKR